MDVHLQCGTLNKSEMMRDCLITHLNLTECEFFTEAHTGVQGWVCSYGQSVLLKTQVFVSSEIEVYWNYNKREKKKKVQMTD